MKHLFEHIKKSIYNPGYYTELLAKPLSHSWKYYSAFALLIVVFLTITSSIPFVAGANRALHEFPQHFFNYYPDDLVIDVTAGKVTINQPEPYAFPIPSSFLADMPEEDRVQFENIAIIDTVTPFSVEQFRAYKTLAWLGLGQMALIDRTGGVRIEQLSPKISYTLTETKLKNLELKAREYYHLVGPTLVILIFVVFMTVFGFNFVYLLFGALCIFAMGRIMHQRFTYGQAYRIGLHAITLPILINTLLSITAVGLTQVPLLFTVVMLATVYMNFKDVHPLTASAAPISPQEDPNAADVMKD